MGTTNRKPDDILAEGFSQCGLPSRRRLPGRELQLFLLTSSLDPIVNINRVPAVRSAPGSDGDSLNCLPLRQTGALVLDYACKSDLSRLPRSVLRLLPQRGGVAQH